MKKSIFIPVLAAVLILNCMFSNAIISASAGELGCDLTRGTEITIDYFDLTSQWTKLYGFAGTAEATYVTHNGQGGYSLTPGNGRGFQSKESFTLKPNRNYIISALIYCDYNREDREVNFGFQEYDKNGKTVLYNFIGTPNDTSGEWQRFEGTVTTSSRTVKGIFELALYGFTLGGDADNKFYISDLHIIELPAVALTEAAPGEGMVFGGSSGQFNMRVTDVLDESGTITVKTTGAEYIFDKAGNEITAYQLINGRRHLFTAVTNKSLSNLSVAGKSNNEAVLTTGTNGLTFGIQMDSLMLIANHGSQDLELTCISAIDGKWNRLSEGNLMAKDDTGGFTVNPYIPMGTGRAARYQASGVDFDGIVNDTDFISSSTAGWSVDYTVTSGELLGMSVFPAREFDWAGSFDNTSLNYYLTGNINRYAEDAETYGVDVAVLWDFTQRGWGMSFGNKYTPKNEVMYQNAIDAAHDAGMKTAAYMSMHYWHNRDIDEYITEVKRHKDTYHIDGVYSDGLPDKEWLAAYEGARKLRELFPAGVLIFHTTGQTGNGGPPMAVPDISIPAIDSYSTMTLRGEGVQGTGQDWEYPKSIAAAYNTSNAIGLMKGDAWYENDGETLVTQRQQELLGLIYNGRARVTDRITDEFIEHYKDYKGILNRLKLSYLFFGDKKDYFTEYYLPLAHKLVRNDLTFDGRDGFDYGFSSESDLSDWDMVSDTGAAVSIQDGVLCIDDTALQSIDGVRHGVDKHPSKLEISFKMKLDSNAGGEVFLTDSNDDKCLGLYAIDGKIRYYGHLKGYKNAGTYVADEWIDVAISVDSAKKTFSVSVGGENIVKSDCFAYGTGLPVNMTLQSGNATKGKIYFDNVTLSYEY